jgi:hypothetical protein
LAPLREAARLKLPMMARRRARELTRAIRAQWGELVPQVARLLVPLWPL